MSSVVVYRISLGLSILLSIAAFFTLLGSIAPLVNGVGKTSWIALMPWTPICLVALAALNCTLRARLIVRRRRV
jgi:hypothetical protein